MKWNTYKGFKTAKYGNQTLYKFNGVKGVFLYRVTEGIHDGGQPVITKQMVFELTHTTEPDYLIVYMMVDTRKKGKARYALSHTKWWGY